MRMFKWAVPYETLSIQNTKGMAEEIALECENFMGYPFVVHQTFFDRVLGNWRVSCLRAHLENGFAWATGDEE